jgi:hypothetical protein
MAALCLQAQKNFDCGKHLWRNLVYLTSGWKRAFRSTRGWTGGHLIHPDEESVTGNNHDCQGRRHYDSKKDEAAALLGVDEFVSASIHDLLSLSLQA